MAHGGHGGQPAHRRPFRQFKSGGIRAPARTAADVFCRVRRRPTPHLTVSNKRSILADVAVVSPVGRAPDEGRRHVTGLTGLAGLARPVALAEERVLPVLPALEPLLPGGGLRRGSTIAVTGSTSLALALLAGPSAAGSWTAAVGLPSLGLVAAAETGVALDRLALVASPGDQWPTVVAALLDALDIVLVCPPGRVRVGDARRLMARARERGAVLVSTRAWDGADVRLSAAASDWDGVGEGHGHLTRRRMDVVATGRGAAARERRATLCLP